jgi:hypothetical protein
LHHFHPDISSANHTCKNFDEPAKLQDFAAASKSTSPVAAESTKWRNWQESLLK